MELRILLFSYYQPILNKYPFREIKERQCFIRFSSENEQICDGNIQYENICKLCYFVLKNITTNDKLHNKIVNHNSKCVLCLKECKNFIGSIEICLKHKKELGEIYLTVERDNNDI